MLVKHPTPRLSAIGAVSRNVNNIGFVLLMKVFYAIKQILLSRSCLGRSVSESCQNLLKLLRLLQPVYLDPEPLYTKSSGVACYIKTNK